MPSEIGIERHVRIIALETSSSLGSIAALEDRRVIKTIELGRVQRTAQSLAPALKGILLKAAWEPKDVELIAVTDGPGSFTGLRTGVTTAKVFAYATGASIVAVNTLEVIAAQADVQTNRLWSVMDAQREQSFVARYQLTSSDLAGSGSVIETYATEIVDNEKWLQLLETGDQVSGTGLATFDDQLPSGVHTVMKQAWSPRATTLGLLALAKYLSGERVNLWKLAPQYYRKSAAEEKIEQGLVE
jgi:tRNA threonylcarbamoyladenosine biosynthesis protein TsaB